MATYNMEEYETKKEIKGWQIDLVDSDGHPIVMDTNHYLMVDQPGGIKEASMWIPEIYKRFYSLFYHRGYIEEMNNHYVMGQYYIISSVVEHLGHMAHGDYFKSTAGNAGRAFLNLKNLIDITLDYCKRHKKPNEPRIWITKAKKVAIYNEHGVFVRWG